MTGPGSPGVHLDLLAHERQPLDHRSQPPAFDFELLEQAGLLDRLPEWREIAEEASLFTAQVIG
jgi:hypothetical protein